MAGYTLKIYHFCDLLIFKSPRKCGHLDLDLVELAGILQGALVRCGLDPPGESSISGSLKIDSFPSHHGGSGC